MNAYFVYDFYAVSGCPKAVSPLSSCDSFTPKQEDMENKTATKTCPRCGRTLPVENFGRHSKTKDGYQPICQDCRKEAMKKGREKKEKVVVNKTFRNVAPASVDVLLKDATYSDLVAELRKRGCSGTIKLTLDF